MRYSMARRKQREPKRSPDIKDLETPPDCFNNKQDDVKIISLDSHRGGFVCTEKETDDAKTSVMFYKLTNHNQMSPDAGHACLLSETNDFNKTLAKKNKEDEPLSHLQNNVLENLMQMKEAYTKLISDSLRPKFSIKKMHCSAKSNVVDKGNAITNKLNRQWPNESLNTSNNKHIDDICAKIAYDWHQTALIKTLQQSSHRVPQKPGLFSTVQLYRQSSKPCDTVFSGASKFKCKDCSAAYDRIVDLTIHMNKNGHYRDNNKDEEDEKDNGKNWSKPRKRSLWEMEGKDDAHKILKCMYCGYSFESLQDLSVHMIKTKHYQKMPFKDPEQQLTPNKLLLTENKSKGVLISKEPHTSLSEEIRKTGISNHYVTPNNRYGYQKGASYSWQYEARKEQILKCMECGSSHNSLHQLTTHMMATGHFLKITNSAIKRGKQLAEEKIQSIPLPPATTKLPTPSSKEQFSITEDKNVTSENYMDNSYLAGNKMIKVEQTEFFSDSTPDKYLTEGKLKKSPKKGMDHSRLLESTVSNVISTAQGCTSTWGEGYSTLHDAYQALKSARTQHHFDTSVMSDSGTDVYTVRNSFSALEKLVDNITGRNLVKQKRIMTAQLPMDRDAGDTKMNNESAHKHGPEELTMEDQNQNCHQDSCTSPTADSLNICNGLSPKTSFNSTIQSLRSITPNECQSINFTSCNPSLKLHKNNKPLQHSSIQKEMHFYTDKDQPIDLSTFKTKRVTEVSITTSAIPVTST